MSSLILNLSLSGIFILVLSVTKWMKSLSMVIILEFCSILILGMVFLSFNGLDSWLIALVVFLVSESLILLSAIFALILISGVSASSISIF